jgi:hypothetical protein
MKWARWLSLLGVVVMTIALANGFVNGRISEEGGQLLSMPWGIVSLVDLYVGFALFSGWILYREATLWKAFLWILLMMVLGFFTGALYTFLAFQNSDGDWKTFWLGARR